MVIACIKSLLFLSIYFRFRRKKKWQANFCKTNANSVTVREKWKISHKERRQIVALQIEGETKSFKKFDGDDGATVDHDHNKNHSITSPKSLPIYITYLFYLMLSSSSSSSTSPWLFLVTRHGKKQETWEKCKNGSLVDFCCFPFFICWFFLRFDCLLVHLT